MKKSASISGGFSVNNFTIELLYNFRNNRKAWVYIFIILIQ